MEKIIFDNGFRLILDPAPWFKSCSMGIWVGSGSRFESPEDSGTSHFIEHMLFKGTENHSTRDIAVITDETGGSLNAYTSKECTCLYAKTLTEHIGRIFSLMSEMITAPSLNDSDIKLEKGVVLEEIASYEDSSDDLCADTFYECLWRDDMLGSNIAGTRSSVMSLNREKLAEHMKRFYVPERTVAVFSGNFDKSEVLDLCNKYFGSLQNTGNPITANAAKPYQFIKRVRKRFEQNVITIGLPGICSEDESIHAFTYACNMLGGTGSSRLFQRLREELGLVYSVEACNIPFLRSGAFTVSMALSHKNEEKAVAETVKIIKDFSKSITRDEFSRMKVNTLSAVTMALESTSYSSSRLGRNEIILGKSETGDELLQSLEAVTFDEVHNISEKVFDISKLSLCVVGKVGSQNFYRNLLNIN